MRRDDFLAQFRALEAAGRLTDADIEKTCAAIAAEAAPSREAIRALCDIATMPSPERRASGQRAIFTSIVEKLGDSFEPEAVAVYDRMFTQIIDDCRRRPGGEELDRMLDRFGIRGEEDLLDRKRRIAESRKYAGGEQGALTVKQAFVLSRVTMGADVAVTSVLMDGLAAAFPNATVTLVGPAPVADLYRNGNRLRTIDAPYARRGSLLDRLSGWADLVRILDDARTGLTASEFLVIDPDSRLTQLGLLPVREEECGYFFFESRSFQRPGKPSLAELAGTWHRETFGGESAPQPFVRIAPGDELRGHRARGVLRNRKIAAFNFGVGSNEAKGLSPEFEAGLTRGVLQKGYSVILDKGIGAESDRANRIVTEWRAAGLKVLELDSRGELSEPDTGAESVDAITWQGGPGPFAGLIASSDIYAGYDSAFQHIAAALGKPVIDIFVQQNPPRFVERWTPFSRNGAAVQTTRLNPEMPVDTAVSRILAMLP